MPNNNPDLWTARKQCQQLYPPIPGELCEVCKQPKPRLHRHHKDKDVWNNDPDNLEFACGGCHNRLEPRRKKR